MHEKIKYNILKWRCINISIKVLMVCGVEEWEEPSDTENLNLVSGDTCMFIGI